MSIAFNISATGFNVRSAASADVKACRMLLPCVTTDARWLVAVDGARGLVVGAAAVTRSKRTQPLVGPGAAMHVIDPCRRQGVGAALWRQLLDLAQRERSQAVYAAQRVVYDGPEMHAWQWLGMEVCDTVEEHELPLVQFVPRLAPLVERFRRKGRIPDSAQIVPLFAAKPADVLQLHLDHLGGDRESLYQKLRGQGPGAFHPRYSRVLLVDGRVVGCILCHLESRNVAAVDANIVAPHVRGGWANVWLKLEATQVALSLGITQFRFSTFDRYADTRSFTDKLGGAVTRKWALMYRPLG